MKVKEFIDNVKEKHVVNCYGLDFKLLEDDVVTIKGTNIFSSNEDFSRDDRYFDFVNKDYVYNSLLLKLEITNISIVCLHKGVYNLIIDTRTDSKELKEFGIHMGAEFI